MKKLTFLFLILILCMFTFQFNSFDRLIVYADVPENYVNNISDNSYDWYFSEDYLNISKIRNVVSTWFSDPLYSFNDLESDPIVIAVIDSGVNYNHEIFTGESEEENVLYKDQYNKLISKNTVNSNDVLDDDKDKHGTHVAGIIAILIHELNLEKYIKILPIKAGEYKTSDSKVHFESSAFDEAVEFAVENGADVVNMSLSSSSSDYGDIISDDYASKSIFVAAAGNNGKNSANKKYYPAAYSNVIGVMNYMVNSSNEIVLKSTSNYGNSYDLCAPGTEIYSANGDNLISYKKMDGTSMACPFVSFGAALTILKYRAIENVTGVTKTISEITSIIRGSSVSKIDSYKVYDYYSSIINEDEIYGVIRVLNGSLNQEMNNIKNLELSLDILPEHLDDGGTYTWYLNNNLFSTNKTFNYSPNNSFGYYNIKCKWISNNNKYQIEASTCLYVSYIEVNNENINKVELEYNVDNNQYLLSIKDLDYYSNDSKNSILWYVNDICVSAGQTFIHDFDEGEYYIVAKINGYFTQPIKIVIENKHEDEKLSNKLICTIVFSTVFGFSLIILIIVLILKKKNVLK